MQTQTQLEQLSEVIKTGEASDELRGVGVNLTTWGLSGSPEATFVVEYDAKGTRLTAEVLRSLKTVTIPDVALNSDIVQFKPGQPVL